MANKEQLAILMQGTSIWNKWRIDNPNSEIDLDGTDLREAELSEADLRRANLLRAYLSVADMRQADLRGANLDGADLRKADLRKAILVGTNLVGANLSGADLSQAHLDGANLSRAQLAQANLSKARLGHTVFGEVDLSKTYGLEDVVHGAASTIGIDTIRLSNGIIPVAFLRGCGLTDLEVKSVKLIAIGLDLEQITNIC